MDSEETTGIIIGSLVAWFCLLCCMTMCLVLYSSVCFSLVLALPVLGSLPCASCIPLARSTLNRIRHAQNQDEPTGASSTGIIIHSLVAGSSPTPQFRSSSAAPNAPELVGSS